MRRLFWTFSAVVLISGLLATPQAAAQEQSIGLYVGSFHPRDFDARGGDDVLLRNRQGVKPGLALLFDLKDFNGATFGGEWLIGLGDYIDAGLGIAFYQRTGPAIYRDRVNANGSEIEQDLKLRVVPFSATVRVLPLGHRGLFKPYVGGGVAVMNWRYSEFGQFIDAVDLKTIFAPDDSFSERGWATGPVILGGVTLPINKVNIGGEVRYQSGKGKFVIDPKTGFSSNGFAGTKIDLGGLNFLFMVNVRF